MYRQCTCTGNVHVQAMYMYRQCTCTGNVPVTKMNVGIESYICILAFITGSYCIIAKFCLHTIVNSITIMYMMITMMHSNYGTKIMCT